MRAHGDVLTGTHRQGSGEQTGGAGEQDDRVRHAGRADAEDEREVRDQPVVGAEDGGTEVAGQAGSGAGGRGPGPPRAWSTSSAAISAEAASSSS